MKWKMIKLGDVITFRGGGTPRKDVPEYWSDEIPWATVKDFKGLVLERTRDFISPQGLASSASNLIPSGHVIIPTRMALGKAAINAIDLAINQDLRALIPKVPIDTVYLLHMMLGLSDEIQSYGSGATVKGITQEKLSELKIPLPPIEEQKRIAAILDAADALRAKRRESIAQLDALLQSTFLDMFGDPVTNPMGWEKVKLGESGEVITGNTPSRSNPKYYGDFIEWIKSDNINTPSCFLTKAQEGLSELGKKVARVAPAGSILITCIAGSPACIGNAAIVDRVVAFNQQINAFMPGSDVELWYMFMLLVVGKSLIQSSSTKSMKGMVSKSALSSVSIPLPPLSLQRRFSSIVEAAERQKARLRAHLDELDALFSSLQSRAFNGEL
jgi:type I restriction enzyme S subunit